MKEIRVIKFGEQFAICIPRPMAREKDLLQGEILTIESTKEGFAVKQTGRVRGEFKKKVPE